MENSTNKSNNEIKYGSIISYVLIALNIVLGLIYTPWILHQIGSSNYGLFTLASSLTALFLMDFGLSAMITRYICIYRAKNDQSMINGFVRFSIKMYLFIMLVIACVLMIVYLNIDYLYKNMTVNELEMFKSVFLIVSFYIIICFPVNICNGILNAYEEYVLLKSSDIFNKLGTVIITIVVLMCNGGLIGLVLVNGIFNITTFLLKVIIILKKTPINLKLKKNNTFHFSKEILSFQIWSTIQTLSQQMIFNLIPSILAIVLNTSAITLFGFANVIEGYIFTITNAINGLFLPKVSRIIVDDNNAKNTLPLMIKVGRINQLIITLIIIGFLVLGEEFINLWVGSEYKNLYICIILLCTPYLVSSSQQIANTSLVALNKIKYIAIINVITGILNLVLIYNVAGKYGIIGVCCIIGFTFWIRIVLYNFLYYKLLSINIFDFFKECHLKLLLPILISFIFAIVINLYVPVSYISTNAWIQFLVKIILIIFDYFVVMWLFGLNKFEKNLIFSFMNK